MLFPIAVTLAGLLILSPSPAQTPSGSTPVPRKKIRVSPEVLSRGLEKENVPVYPEEALQQHNQGQVTVRVLVDEAGHVEAAQLVNGDPQLGNAAIDGARGYQFRPYRLNGEAIAVDSQMIFVFSIKGHGQKARGRVEYLK